MKKVTLWVGAIVVIALAAFWFFSSSNTGTINLYLTDLPAGAEVSSVFVTLSDIQVHYAGSDTQENYTQEGEWRTVVTGPITYDLLTVKDAATFLGSEEVQAGKYTQIRLNVSHANATIGGQDYELTIPSGTVRIVRNFDVIAGQEIKLTLDFNAEDSLIEQGNNRYRLQPTIKLLLNNEPKE